MPRQFLGVLLLLSALCSPITGRAVEPKVELSVEPAPVSSAEASGRTVGLTVAAKIAPGWHINAHQPKQPFLVPTTLKLALPAGVTADDPRYPEPLTRSFSFAGDEQLSVYEGEVPINTRLRIPADFADPALRLVAELRYQACNDTTCLPPTTARVERDIPLREHAAAGGMPPSPEATLLDAGGALAALNREGGGYFENLLQRHGLLLTALVMLGLGVALNLTPCVYPLISVTVAYFGGQTRSRRGTVLLAAVYVLGIAISFSALGLLSALSGGVIGSALQRPAVLLGIAAVLLILAAGSFGLYQLRPPTVLLRWAGGAATGAAGALFMGLTMGVVAAPCVGPILVGLLVFVGTRQDAGLGFALFFSLALGMGAPYLVLALLAGSLRRLPRSGEWLSWSEHLFGCVLICLAVYYVAPLLPLPAKAWALPVAVAASGIYLGFLDPVGRSRPAFVGFKATAGVLALAVAVWMIPSAQPAQAITWEPFDSAAVAADARPVLVDFGAEWCIPCREMKATTYVDPDVVREARRFRMVRADITSESEHNDALTSRYDVKGVPTVILFTPGGDERRRLVGYVSPDEMLAAMREVH
ncbi:MAG: protein-disulfide reductase DsbD family protein [Candidatus Binatia bacterium]